MSKPILPALAVDAACSGNPGVMEFRGVIADTGTEVFHRGPFVQGTNNIGEFLALVLGLAYQEIQPELGDIHGQRDGFGLVTRQTM